MEWLDDDLIAPLSFIQSINYKLKLFGIILTGKVDKFLKSWNKLLYNSSSSISLLTQNIHPFF